LHYGEIYVIILVSVPLLFVHEFGFASDFAQFVPISTPKTGGGTNKKPKHKKTLMLQCIEAASQLRLGTRKGYNYLQKTVK